jgi:hypothetical protein
VERLAVSVNKSESQMTGVMKSLLAPLQTFRSLPLTMQDVKRMKELFA